MAVLPQYLEIWNSREPKRAFLGYNMVLSVVFILKMGTFDCSVLECCWCSRRDHREDNARKNHPSHPRTPTRLPWQDIPVFSQNSLAWAVASWPHLVKKFKVNFQKLFLDLFFTHGESSLIPMYNTKSHETNVTLSAFLFFVQFSLWSFKWFCFSQVRTVLLFLSYVLLWNSLERTPN